MTEYGTITEQDGRQHKIRILGMTAGELDAHWDKIEAVMGKIEDWPGGRSRPSSFLLQAYHNGLIPWGVAMDLYQASIGMACTDP